MADFRGLWLQSRLGNEKANRTHTEESVVPTSKYRMTSPFSGDVDIGRVKGTDAEDVDVRDN